MLLLLCERCLCGKLFVWEVVCVGIVVLCGTFLFEWDVFLLWDVCLLWEFVFVFFVVAGGRFLLWEKCCAIMIKLCRHSILILTHRSSIQVCILAVRRVLNMKDVIDHELLAMSELQSWRQHLLQL